MPPALIQALALGDQFAGRHDGVDELHRLGAIDAELIALEQHLQGIARLHQARDALGAAGAGKQPDLDLGQAERVFGLSAATR